MGTQENLTPGARSEAFTGGRIDRRKMTNLEIKMRRNASSPQRLTLPFVQQIVNANTGLQIDGWGVADDPLPPSVYDPTKQAILTRDEEIIRIGLRDFR